jgi:hypothetical protein
MDAVSVQFLRFKMEFFKELKKVMDTNPILNWRLVFISVLGFILCLINLIIGFIGV